MVKFREVVHKIFRAEEMNSLIASRKRSALSRKEIKEIQERKFKELYSYCLCENEYYRNAFRNIIIDKIDDLYKLPILTKSIIKKEYLNLITQRDKIYFDNNSTSGSTGEATKFGSDSRYIVKRDVDGIRGNEMNKRYRYLDKMLIFWGANRDILNKRNFKNSYNYYLKQIKTISTYHMNDMDIIENIKFINTFKPKLIVGYPSALSYMADYLAKNQETLRHIPNAIISAGEMLYEVQKEKIENHFYSKVYNRYGCREVGHIASECSERRGLHYDADRLIIEIVDDNGNHCPPGVVGNILVTDLQNYVFPLIRYNIGDLGSLCADSKCQCGCNLPKIEKLVGRSFDVVKGTNGNSLAGPFWTLAFRYEIKGIEQFQIKQSNIGEIELRIKVNNYFDEIEVEKIQELVKKMLGETMIVKISKVDNFEVSPTGKYKWIISELG